MYLTEHGQIYCIYNGVKHYLANAGGSANWKTDSTQNMFAIDNAYTAV